MNNDAIRIKPNQTYYSLNVLRGFLALFVVLYHVPNLSQAVGLPGFNGLALFNKGEEAVAVFFTLSGYLIIGLLFDEKAKYGKINIKNFYLRRILRLYPVYYLVLIFGLLYYQYILPLLGVPYELEYSLLDGVLWNVGFLPNVFQKLYHPGSILLILWSIGIEEQFYLIIAPLLASFNHYKYLKYVLAFTILYMALFLGPFASFLQKYSFLYFYISAGGAVALATRLGYCVSFKHRAARVVVYGLFFLYFMSDWYHFLHDGLKAYVEVVLFTLFIANVVVDDKYFKKMTFLKYLGRISYGIYMYHMIVLNAVLFCFMKISVFITLNDALVIVLINMTCLIGTFMVAHISYQYYEKFFLKLKQNYRREGMKRYSFGRKKRILNLAFFYSFFRDRA